MNTLLAGVISMLGFQACDKDDDTEEKWKCMYGPAPTSYQAVDDSDFQTVDNDSDINSDINSQPE